MTAEHAVDGVDMAVRKPIAFDVLIDDEDVAVAIAAAEQDGGVVTEAVIESGEQREIFNRGRRRIRRILQAWREDCREDFLTNGLSDGGPLIGKCKTGRATRR